QQSGVDDAVNLPQRHARYGRRFIGCQRFRAVEHEIGPTIFPISWKNYIERFGQSSKASSVSAGSMVLNLTNKLGQPGSSRDELSGTPFHELRREDPGRAAARL